MEQKCSYVQERSGAAGAIMKESYLADEAIARTGHNRTVHQYPLICTVQQPMMSPKVSL
jgi:hypothetical protein